MRLGIFGLWMLLVTYVVMLVIHFAAVIGGGTVMIMNNLYGEQLLESIMFIISIPFVLIFVYDWYKNEKTIIYTLNAGSN